MYNYDKVDTFTMYTNINNKYRYQHHISEFISTKTTKMRSRRLQAGGGLICQQRFKWPSLILRV